MYPIIQNKVQLMNTIDMSRPLTSLTNPYVPNTSPAILYNLKNVSVKNRSIDHW